MGQDWVEKGMEKLFGRNGIFSPPITRTRPDSDSSSSSSSYNDDGEFNVNYKLLNETSLQIKGDENTGNSFDRDDFPPLPEGANEGGYETGFANSDFGLLPFNFTISFSSGEEATFSVDFAHGSSDKLALYWEDGEEIAAANKIYIGGNQRKEGKSIYFTFIVMDKKHYRDHLEYLR